MAMNMDAAIRIAAKVTGQQQLTGLGQSLKGISSSARLTDQQIGQLNRVVKGTAAAAGNSTAALRNHLSALQALRERADIGGKAYNRLGVEIDQLRGKLRGLDTNIERSRGGFDNLSGVLGRLAIAASVFQAGQFIIAKTSELETQTRSIQTLTGSLDRSKQIISELQQIGAVTPFTSTELIESAKRLVAFGVSADQVVETTRRLGDVAGATGANLGELSLAYGQVIAKGRLQGEELLQFQERGVALQDELRKMYGLTGQEFSKALEKGQISAEAVEIALQRLTDTGGKYANGAIAQSDTLAGKFSTLTDGVETLARTVGAALTPAIRAVLNEALFAINAINQLIATGARAKSFGLSQAQRQQILRQAQNEAEQIVNLRQIRDPFERNKQFQELARQRERDLIEAYGIETGQVKLPAKAPSTRSSIPPLTGGAAAGGGGGGRARSAAGATDQAAKAAAAAAAKVQASGVDLANARELYDIEGRILEARLEDNQQLIFARNAQKELLSIRQQAAAIIADKELPAAARKNALDKLAVQSGSVSRQLAFDLAELENKRALTAQEAINKLADERELLQAQLMGTEAEIILKQRLRELTKGMTDDEKARVEALVRGNEALRQQKEAAEQMKQLYGDIGMSIKDGVVGAIQGAIDGTKSLQEVASNLLQSIANKLLDVAINMALFGTMSGTGTGGGLLGFLFKKQAKGGAWENGIQAFARGGIVNKPTLLPLAGEAGPEAIMPLKRLPSGRLGVEAAGGGSGGSVNVVVNVDAKGSRVEGDQQQGAALGRAISTAVQAELVKQQRPGGLLAGAR